jgi:hypothetical protein
MEMAMCRLLSLLTSILAALVLLGACGPRPLPPVLGGWPLEPGQYVKESYFAPGFKPENMTYSFSTFTVASADGAPAEVFVKIFQDELARAWQAQGLKLGAGKQAANLSGTIPALAISGVRRRWLTGRVHASLIISGELTHGGQALFAFRDQLSVNSPLAPGPPPPREQELLLRLLARETVHHLLNELLLHGATGPSVEDRSASTRK